MAWLVLGVAVVTEIIWALSLKWAGVQATWQAASVPIALSFVNMGLLCGLAAVVVTSRAGAAVAAAGQNYELDAIAACFIGGAAVTGGIGRVSGAIIGALIMGVLNMGLSIMGVDPSWQFVIKGLVLIVAVAFDMVNKARSSKS